MKNLLTLSFLGELFLQWNVHLHGCRVSALSVDILLSLSRRLAESRTNPQVLDIGVTPQDWNAETDWDKTNGNTPNADTLFGLWAQIGLWEEVDPGTSCCQSRGRRTGTSRPDHLVRHTKAIADESIFAKKTKLYYATWVYMLYFYQSNCIQNDVCRYQSQYCFHVWLLYEM